jgi:ElaB/YqjD/DUF883 family membrane-anchored ribosome-binding protein
MADDTTRTSGIFPEQEARKELVQIIDTYDSKIEGKLDEERAKPTSHEGELEQEVIALREQLAESSRSAGVLQRERDQLQSRLDAVTEGIKQAVEREKSYMTRRGIINTVVIAVLAVGVVALIALYGNRTDPSLLAGAVPGFHQGPTTKT